MMNSNSASESSSESGVILIASLLTSIKRIPSLRKIIRLFSCDQSNSNSSGSTNGNKIKCLNNGCNGFGKYKPTSCDSSFSCREKNNLKNNSINSSNSNCESTDDGKLQFGQSLCKVTDVPSYLQFNPFILSGYRKPCMTSYECLKSLLYFHNETINIMTHGELIFKITFYYFYKEKN